MEFKVLRTGHLVYRVRDIEAAKRLWIDTLGFDISSDNGRGMYFLSGDVAENDHMVAIRPGEEGQRMPVPDEQVGLVTMAYEVASLDDLKSAYGKIKGLGLDVRDTLAKGASYGFTFADYDGNLFELFCRRTPKERTDLGAGPFDITGSIESVLEDAAA